MAGHSKFKNIMHRKGAQDAKRAKVFNKLAREITVAAKTGGSPDPGFNPRLRTAIAAAKAESMPKDRIEKAIQVAQGAGQGDDYSEMRYEGYGPGGTAIIIEALTDNKNRTASELRAAFNKNGGNLGETNSVAFNFTRTGYLKYKSSIADFETIFEDAAEAGAEDVELNDDVYDIYCAPEDLGTVRDALEAKYETADECKLIWRPNVSVDVPEDPARTLLKLIDVLEDNDDVQDVYSNSDISDDVLERLAAE